MEERKNTNKEKEIINKNDINVNKNINTNSSINKNKLLNVLLSIIVLITVFIGSLLYYHLYTYSNKEIIDTNEVNNVASIADMIDSAIDSTSNSSVNEIEDGEIENKVENNNVTVTTGEADSRKVLNESIIVLYDGLILDADNMDLVELKYIDNSSDTKEDYVITYYNYENYGYKNSTLGTISQQVLDGLVKIDGVGKIAISENYEAIPRDIQVINSIPAVVLENNSDFDSYDSKKTIIVDLDGNGTNEYIVILANKSTGESKIVLVESTGLKKAILATMNKSGWDSITTDGYYLSYSNIEVLDIDNDGILEILFELPTTDSIPSQVNLLKYKNGDLAGKTDISCSLVK